MDILRFGSKCRNLVLVCCSNPLINAAEVRLAETPLQLSELSRRVVETPEGRVTYIRVRPPVLPPAPPPPPVREPSAAELEAELAYAAKDYVYLNVFATVYLDGSRVLSELRVRDEAGRDYFTAWSNVDFRQLTQLHYLESATAVYSWFPFVDVADLRIWPEGEPRPALPAIKFDPTTPDYVIALAPGQTAPSETDPVLAGLDFLHAYYALNAERLRSDFAALEQAQAAFEAAEVARRKAPPVRRDTVIHFWPVNSSSRR